MYFVQGTNLELWTNPETQWTMRSAMGRIKRRWLLKASRTHHPVPRLQTILPDFRSSMARHEEEGFSHLPVSELAVFLTVLQLELLMYVESGRCVCADKSQPRCPGDKKWSTPGTLCLQKVTYLTRRVSPPGPALCTLHTDSPCTWPIYSSAAAAHITDQSLGWKEEFHMQNKFLPKTSVSVIFCGKSRLRKERERGWQGEPPSEKTVTHPWN